jgi:hypothetical protein
MIYKDRPKTLLPVYKLFLGRDKDFLLFVEQGNFPAQKKNKPDSK